MSLINHRLSLTQTYALPLGLANINLALFIRLQYSWTMVQQKSLVKLKYSLLSELERLQRGSRK